MPCFPDLLFNSPLFNQEFLFGSFGDKDSYNIYDWPLFHSSISAAAIYKQGRIFQKVTRHQHPCKLIIPATATASSKNSPPHPPNVISLIGHVSESHSKPPYCFPTRQSAQPQNASFIVQESLETSPHPPAEQSGWCPLNSYHCSGSLSKDPWPPHHSALLPESSNLVVSLVNVRTKAT